MNCSLAPVGRVRWGMLPATAAAFSALFVMLGLSLAQHGLQPFPPAPTVEQAAKVDPTLQRLAQRHNGGRVEVIVQLQRDVSPESGRTLVRSLHGRVTGELPIIHGFAAQMSAPNANKLASLEEVHAVTLNARVKPQAVNTTYLATSYNHSISSPKVWSNYGATGKGVGVAVVDTGIAGDLPDFRLSQPKNENTPSRVVGAAVTNPDATSAGDSYGHGTHVAGIIAGNGLDRPSSDPLYGKYIGVAPDANLISVKVSDEHGNATVLDVIYGLQFVVDHKSDFNIRVVNLSLESTQSQSYRTDPLDAAAESAWFNGIVVVAALGNRGISRGAVDYAPGNDPYVISVGAIDDHGTNGKSDDGYASWSSVGVTEDGYPKPEVAAPGAHIVSTLAPDSAFASMCRSCIVDGQYIRAGGTSMAAPMVSGTVADLLQLRPGLSPNQVKGVLMATLRSLPTKIGELNASHAAAPNAFAQPANLGLRPNTLVDPSTGSIDYTRSTWSRSTWSTAPDGLRASWARSTWSCDCSGTSNGSVAPGRSTWSRSTWSTSWDK